MEFEAGQTHLMPVSFGPLPPHPAGCFEDVRTLMVIYRTTAEAIAKVLPPGFIPGAQPLLYAYVQRCRGVNFLAGGEYRLFGCNVSATYVSGQQAIDGQYALILWENDIEAIIRGREILGIPKLLAEVDDPVEQGDGFRVTARERGHELITMRLSPGTPMDEEALNELKVGINQGAWFGWKHIPRVDGVGVEVSHPTKVGIANALSAAWECTGEVTLGSVEWSQCPTSASIVAGLREIPLKECLRAYRTEGTVTLTRADHRVLA